MACATAEEVRARLGFFALAPLLREASGSAADDGGGDVGQASLLHRRARAEIDEVLKSGLQRRLKRLERRMAELAAAGGEPAGARDAAAGAPAPVALGAEASARLQEACSKALKTAAIAARPQLKVFGPTSSQRELPDPPEKEEAILPETETLRGTLDNLRQNLAARERQVKALTDQLAECQKIHKGHADEAESLSAQLKRLQEDPAHLQRAHGDRLARRAARRKEEEGSLRLLRMQAEQYEKMVQDQRTFFLQSERIAVSGGPSMLARHPCGEIALVPRPLSMANEQPEVWDVGTAVANPYVVDSWPFEPNVLARRTMQEAPTMQPFKEETEEDLREASGPARRSPFGAFDFRLAMPTRDSEDEDDGFNSRYGGPTETSRSM